MLSKFAERDSSEIQEHGSNTMSPGEILAIVIAALTLLVAMIPLLRCPRFHRWPLSSISPFVKVYLPLLVLSKLIHIHILNLEIFHRGLELLFQTLSRQSLLPQRAQTPPQLLISLYLVLSSFTMTIPTPTLLAPILIPSSSAPLVSLGKIVLVQHFK